MQTQYAIEFDHVSKVFPNAANPSVEDCTFQIEKGEFIVILGASGSGKTTLLKMVNRLYAPTSGKIRVDGVPVDAIRPVLLRRSIGYVIQQIALYPHMTVEKNIATVPEILGWNRKKVRNRVDDLLNLVHLPPDEYAKRYPRELSGGQQQRVGIARALAGNPAVLLMDEPFGAVDAITRASLQQEIKHIQQDLNKTLLFVTHDVEEALKLADRIIVMEHGRIIQFASPLEILAHPATPFVRDLTHADDVLQRLSLMSVQSALEPFACGVGEKMPDRTSESAPREIPGDTPDKTHNEVAAGIHKNEPGGVAAVEIGSTLKDALAVMVQNGSSEVTVLGKDHCEVGKVTLDGLSKVGS
jgi:osmoprotectant transport system ATP-binding protein